MHVPTDKVLYTGDSITGSWYKDVENIGLNKYCRHDRAIVGSDWRFILIVFLHNPTLLWISISQKQRSNSPPRT
jgi:hypothetical protein